MKMTAADIKTYPKLASYVRNDIPQSDSLKQAEHIIDRRMRVAQNAADKEEGLS